MKTVFGFSLACFGWTWLAFMGLVLLLTPFSTNLSTGTIAFELSGKTVFMWLVTVMTAIPGVIAIWASRKLANRKQERRGKHG